MKLFPDHTQDIENLKRVSDDNSVIIQTHELKIRELKKQIDELSSKSPAFSPEFVDLQAKMGQLWNLLTAQTPKKEIKLNRMGRRLGEKIK